ncbi:MULTISPECIES: pseudouridine synthase [Idiomarina]|uniref:pseudouridine synthase n=1 Tax=Idiomarinaceae TaxID=267893 RepID=UPI00129C0B67|nr:MULTISPECIES: pseudouridine synthase [Idiomarina]MRJ40890.1 pseudouridine synthase [Idiomarina sp. FeN1]NCU56694.1 pseudouridine synthase [Idiomarina sp. FenA--70]NCU59074.1 pseudouridine synthase [Idiomarina sp. FenBw--71]UUN14433.1 pseudouridine synthase [Idiomarina loihiensis]
MATAKPASATFRRRSRKRSPNSGAAARPRTANPKLVLLNKPYGVLSQFSGSADEQTLKGLIPHNDVYPAGRLDKDSEGLLLLTNDGVLQHKISHPSQKLQKTYWVQVEGEPTAEALQQLRQGVELNDGITLPAEVMVMPEPQNLWPRNPPVRERLSVPDSWLCLKITEGRNRQVRRMTAAVGLPTLRLIRAGIGPFLLRQMQPGEWREEPPVW